MFPKATTQGEVASETPSLHFALMASELQGQEESQAAPVMVAHCRTGIGPGVPVRTGAGGS